MCISLTSMSLLKVHGLRTWQSPRIYSQYSEKGFVIH